MKKQNLEFNNRQAYYNYFIDNKFNTGIVLMGTEVKSIREGKVSFNDAFCMIDNGEIWLRGLYIAEYKLGTTNNHIAVHDRKLLLQKREIKKIIVATKEKGLTIIPLKVFINDNNLVKVEIGIAKGKKNYDKRETIKSRDTDREIKKYLV
jgi:SsrA-binding protein